MPHNDILAKLKNAIRSVSDNIQNYVSNPGDFSRNGKLPADVLIEFLIGQGSRSTRNELIDAFSYSKDHPSAPALVQKRAKLSPAALRDVLYRFNQSLEPSSSSADYRFFAADGSTLTFLSSSIFSSDDYFTTQGNSAKGAFSVHLTAFHDLDYNRYSDAVIQPISQKDEYGAFSTIVDRHPLPVPIITWPMSCKEVSSSSSAPRTFTQRACCTILISLPMMSSTSPFLSSLSAGSPKSSPSRMAMSVSSIRILPSTSLSMAVMASLYCLRVVRFKLSSGDYEALVTNLPVDDFSFDELKKLYFRRWGIETSFRHLKYTIGLSKFHAKKASFITQEIWARLISYNFTSASSP